MTRNNSKEYDNYLLEELEELKRRQDEKQTKEGNVKWTSTNGETTYFPEGITPIYRNENQKRVHKDYCEKVEGIKEFTNDKDFVHLIFQYGSEIFKEIGNKAPGAKGNLYIIRFIMLAVNTNYEGEITYLEEGKKKAKRIKKADLTKVWDVKDKKGINDTYNLLKDCGYIYEEDGYIMMNKDMVIKGDKTQQHINNMNRRNNCNYNFTRLFAENIQEIYYATESKHRKHLANLFRILPYVNFKFNVFCSNPTQENEDEVELLDWKDLAEIAGVDKSNLARFKKDLKQLVIGEQYTIGQFEIGGRPTIIINPNIYYGGKDIDAVKGIGNIFKMNLARKDK